MKKILLILFTSCFWITSHSQNKSTVLVQGIWGLGGNTITAGSAWLGTINNARLNFITNNVNTMSLDSLGSRLFLKGGVDPLLSLQQATSSQEYQIRLGINTGIAKSGFNIYDATNSKIRMYMNGENVAFGNVSSIPTVSRMYLFGGASGANFDARGDSTVVDESNIEVENSGYDGVAFAGYGVGMQVDGNVGSAGTILGFPVKNMGQLRFTNTYNLIRVINNASLWFGTNNTKRMVLDSNGRLGIGTSLPTEVLQVTGNVRFSGALMPNNTAGTSGQVLTSAGAGVVPTWADAATGTVTSVSVVTNQGVSGSVATATTTPAITLTLGALTGVTSFNGLIVTANTGAITTGTWNGTIVTGTYGGTGINNGSSTITLGGSLVTSGAFTTTLTSTATTNATLPAGTNTLYSTKSASITSAQLLASLSDPTGTGVAVFGTSPAITTSITTASTTFALLNTTATTINAFGAATTVNTGASATQIWNFGGSTTSSEFRFLEPSGSGTNYTALKAVAQSANITYSLPPTVGAAGTVLTDVAGDGVLTWVANGSGSGTVTSVSFTGGLITVATATTTPAFTVAGTSGGIPYFSSTSTWASSALLAANAIMIGGGAGATPATTTTGTGVLTALGVNVGSAGAFVTFNGALGTPSSGTITNLTGTASININGTVGGTTPAAGTFTAAIANSFVPNSSTVPSNGLYLPASNTLGWAINSAAETQLTSTALSPAADGGNSLGTTSLGWQNLFANTGFVLNIENSDWVATHTTGILTVGTGDLRVTTAGTNSASVVTVGGTQTLTNKTLTSPVIATITNTGTLTLPTVTGTLVQVNNATTASSATPTPTGDAIENNFDVTALAANATFSAPSGTPTNHNELIIRITSDATPRTLAWNAIYRASSDLALPVITVASKSMYLKFIYNSLSSTWDFVAYLSNF